jgi:hypothetical protein
MSDEQLYGLRRSEYGAIGRIVRNDRITERPATSTPTKDRNRYRGIARVILLDPDEITYQPRTRRTCGLFRYQPDGQQTTLEFSGDSLEGDIVLTIHGAELHVDCKADTTELREALAGAGFSLSDIRATVFPGLWEFDLNFGRFATAAASITAEPYEPPPGDTDTPFYSGELKLVREAWCSATDDADTYKTVETVDWIPFKNAAVNTGAIGAALWEFSAGWLVMAWQCREFSFATEDPYAGGGA